MPADMMPLLERLVVAVESMSDDVKTISGSLNELSVNVFYLLKEKTHADVSSLPHEAPDLLTAEGHTLFESDQPHQYGCENSSLASNSHALRNERSSENTASLNLRGADGDMVLQVDHIDESNNWSSASKIIDGIKTEPKEDVCNTNGDCPINIIDGIKTEPKEDVCNTNDDCPINEGLAETSTLSGTVDILEETFSNYHRKYSYSESVRDNSEQTARRNFPQNCNDCDGIPLEPCVETYLAPSFSKMEETEKENEQEGISEEREEMEMEEEDSRNPCSQIHDIVEVVKDETIDISEDWSASLQSCTVQRYIDAEKNGGTCSALFPETRQFAEKVLHSKASTSNSEQSFCSKEWIVNFNVKCFANNSCKTLKQDSSLSFDDCEGVCIKALNRSSGVPFLSKPEETGREEDEANLSQKSAAEFVEAGERGCINVRTENRGIHEERDAQKIREQRSFRMSAFSGQGCRQPKQKMSFCCETCNKCFKSNAHLKDHIRVHTGEKPFKCPLCTKTFSLKSNLVRHMRVHSGEKPFSCNICKRAFILRQVLVKHMRTHSGK